ncbi:MAG: hypothetical protein P8099_13390 [Gemmatimonadota bacterium]
MKNVGKLAVATLLLLAPAAVTAQAFGASLDGGYYFPAGSGYDGYDNALGFDGRLFVQFRGGLELGVGVAHIAYKASGGGLSADIPHWEVYAEPRYDINLGVGFTPFIGARLGVIHESVSVLGIGASASGFTVAAVGGGNVALNRSVALGFTLLVAHQAFGDTTVQGQTIADSAYGAQTIGLRVGLRFVVP